MPFMPPFPEPGGFVKYWDESAKKFAYAQLVDKIAPLIYPWRLGSVAPGGKTATKNFRDLNPSETNRHYYLCYVGFRPGAFFYVSVRYDQEQLNWDEAVVDVNRDLTRWLNYEASPYASPTFNFWINRDAYPGIAAINVSEQNLTPELIVVAAGYKVLEEEDLDAQVLSQLRSGAIPSAPIRFGGPFS